MDAKKYQLIAIGLLILALFHMPYGYYSFMRLAISGICVYMIYQELQDKTWAFFFYCACLILHNPIFKVHFKREEWFYIDIFCAGVFLLLVFIKPKPLVYN